MKILAILSLFILSSPNLSAQKPDTVNLSLDDALELGLKNNYQVQIAKADLQIASNNNTPGNAGRLPTVTAGLAQTNRYDNSENNNLPDTRDEITSHALRPNAGVQMILFNGFRIQTAKENLELSEKNAQTDLRATLENTISEIIHAYYGVLLEQEKLQIQKELMHLSKDRYEYMQERTEIGTAVTYDLLQVKNAFLQDSANYLTQESALNTAMRRLNQALADTSFTNYRLTDDLSSEPKEHSLPEMETQMLQQNATLQMMRTNRVMTENAVKIAQSTKYPSLALNAGSDYTQSWAKYNDSDYNDSYSYALYANLNLSYTIFDGGNRRRRIANAKIETDKMRMQINDLKLQLKSRLYALNDIYEARKQVLRVARENTEAAELNLKTSKERFERGAINSFNYRDVQLNYINAAYTKLQAEYNLTATYTDLLLITGKLSQPAE